ncbi:phosphoribosylglycinamide formyltransferase [Aerococcaceae bacterium DSM 111020]|nr:phosphoribosylglycinamide formyltransferase [Aerococcaceae bacterium DSM 111020]
MNRKKTLAVFISGGGTNLQAIIDACESGGLPASIGIVISNRSDAYGLKRAEAHHIEALVSNDDEEINGILQEKAVDLIILAGYLKVIGEPLLSNYKDRIINIHPSLIPAFSGKGYYGIKVHQAVLDRGVQITGATTHLVNAELDEGRILKQEALRVAEIDTAESLQQRVLEIEHRILIETIQDMIGGI